MVSGWILCVDDVRLQTVWMLVDLHPFLGLMLNYQCMAKQFGILFFYKAHDTFTVSMSMSIVHTIQIGLIFYILSAIVNVMCNNNKNNVSFDFILNFRLTIYSWISYHTPGGESGWQIDECFDNADLSFVSVWPHVPVLTSLKEDMNNFYACGGY